MLHPIETDDLLMMAKKNDAWSLRKMKNRRWLICRVNFFVFLHPVEKSVNLEKRTKPLEFYSSWWSSSSAFFSSFSCKTKKKNEKSFSFLKIISQNFFYHLPPSGGSSDKKSILMIMMIKYIEIFNESYPEFNFKTYHVSHPLSLSLSLNTE